MKIQCTWQEKMKFTGESNQLQVQMDTLPPIGTGTALSPKQLLVAAVCGCTGMDVVSLLRKYKQPLESFQIQADAESTEGDHPIVFKHITLNFILAGNLDREKVLEAIRLSQTKYCGVSAMVSKSVPIYY